MSRQTKDFRFEIKLDPLNDGSFSGLAAVYGNVDLGNDVIEPGAFSKTIVERKGTVPLLWQHDPSRPIGMGKLVDSADGLRIEGKLALGVSYAKDAYEAIKSSIVDGLSIGYDVVKRDFKDNVRYLKEIKLWEVSLVTFPMNEMARVSSVKSEDDAFATLREFTEDIKAGRRLSTETLARLQAAMNELSALLTTSEEEAGKAAAKHDLTEPDIHSLMDFIKEF